MADNNDRMRLQTMQTQINTLTTWMEEQRKYQQENQDRFEKIQKMMELLLRNQGRAVGGKNSNGGTPGSSVTSVTSSVRDISLGFPHFDGHTPVLEWIFKAEKFFSYHHTPDADRVEIAAIHFEKDVIPWFQMLQRMESVSSWSDLTRALEYQFGPSPFDCPMGELFKLQQTGSVLDYYLKFMSLANRFEGLSNEAVLNCFVSGLDPDIRRDVVAQSPTTLIRVVSLAKLYEEKYAPKVSSRPNNYVHKYTPLSATNTHSNYVSANAVKHTTKSSLPPLLPTPNTPSLKNGAVKKISPAEMQLRHENCLCYFCDDKFTFNHRCPNRQMLMLQLDDDEVESETIFDAHTGDTNSNPESGIESPPHLSLNALKGGPGVGTIRFVAYINTFPVKVLVDGGSSDNFLQPRVANFLKLPVEPAPSFKVMVGNGNYMTSEGMIRELNIQVQGNKFQLPVILLPIAGADLILGAKWLKTLGAHIADYDSLQLKLLHNGRFITLQGENDYSPT
ncbi:Retrotransposon gag domain [Sesbania bispinosa]|nr:Retrotransposon gag domain [Sesbania bispinosa]